MKMLAEKMVVVMVYRRVAMEMLAEKMLVLMDYRRVAMKSRRIAGGRQ